MAHVTTEDDSGVRDNPAGRLLFWLELGQEHSARAVQDQQQTQHTGVRTLPYQVLDVWSGIWGLDKEDHADRLEYTRRSIGLIDAADDVRRLAEASANIMAPSALEHFQEVERAVAYFLDNPALDIHTMMTAIQPTGWHSLRSLDRLLGSEAKEATLSGSQLSDLMDKTQELIASITHADDLSEADRLLLVEKLHEVELALTRCRITGSADLLRATDGLSGGLMRLYMRGVDIVNNPAAKAVWALVGAIVWTIGIAADISAIKSGPLGGLLGLPSPAGSVGPTQPPAPPPALR